MQNLGSGVEEEFRKIFGEEYKHPLRSIFHATPGYVFISADYTGAEIAVAAYQCRDEAMLGHVARNQLPESDPDYYDIHSHVAVAAFGLKCEPSKQGLKKTGKGYLRGIAKKVLFGIFYGRGPKAIAEECAAEGVRVTETEAQAVIDELDRMYPGLLPYFKECETRAGTPGWLATGFGRYCRFPQAMDTTQLKRFGRQAKNFPIQSTVADIVNRAVDFLSVRKTKEKLKTRIVLQIHDDLTLEVPLEEAKYVYEELLPDTMIRSVPVFPADLAGRIRPGAAPQYLGVEKKMFFEWGCPLEDLSPFGISQKQ
jgi:DNA polymerase-1